MLSNIRIPGLILIYNFEPAYPIWTKEITPELGRAVGQHLEN